MHKLVTPIQTIPSCFIIALQSLSLHPPAWLGLYNPARNHPSTATGLQPGSVSTVGGTQQSTHTDDGDSDCNEPNNACSKHGTRTGHWSGQAMLSKQAQFRSCGSQATCAFSSVSTSAFAGAGSTDNGPSRSGKHSSGSSSSSSGKGGSSRRKGSSSNEQRYQLWAGHASQCSSAIKAAATPRQLLQVLQQHAGHMTPYDISTAFAYAAKLCGRRNASHQGTADSERQQLVQELQQLAAQLSCQVQLAAEAVPVPASELAAVVYACGSLQLPAVAELLLHQLLQQDTLQQASTRSLSNAAHGLARAKGAVQDSQLQQLLATFSTQLPAANTQDISNLLWAVADMGRQVPAQQLQDIVDRFVSVLGIARVQAVKDVLWAVATMQQQVSSTQLQAMLDRLTQQDHLSAATAQDISVSLWAVASMGYHVPMQQLKLLLGAYKQKLSAATPQGVKDVLWAVASMDQQWPQERQQLLWHFLHHFRQLLPSAQPQHISLLLWALAKLQPRSSNPSNSGEKQQVSVGVLKASVDQLVSKWSKANGQDIAMTLWACSELRYYPQQLLDSLQDSCQDPGFRRVLQSAGPKALASIAYACAQLGYSSTRLPGMLLQMAVRQLSSGPKFSGSPGTSSGKQDQSSISKQGVSKQQHIGRALANLCWAAAVLDLQDCIPEVLQLAAACRDQWGELGPENMLQLYQAHLWLLDCAAVGPNSSACQSANLAAQQGAVSSSEIVQGADNSTASGSDSQLGSTASGLSGVLEPQQLEQCRDMWQQQLQASTGKASKRQKVVFAFLHELSDTLKWQEPPIMEQPTAGGNFSIDIAAVTASGTRLAIEVNGPWHYLRPGYRLDGPNRARDRALVARDYVVVDVPYFVWQKLNTEQRRRYLLSKIEAAEQEDVMNM